MRQRLSGFSAALICLSYSGEIESQFVFTLDAIKANENSAVEMEPSYSSSFYSSKEMEELFRDAFDPSLVELGFQFVSKGRWIRETGAGFKHLFYFYPCRPGADYFPYGALSFDFVPRVEAGKVRIRPEAKDARVHLVVTDIGFGTDNAISRSRATAKQKCLDLRSPAVSAIKKSLSPVRSLDDALERLGREKARRGIAFYHYPETALSYAFTLAKVRRKAEAESELSTLLQKQGSHFPPETHAQIRQWLSQAPA